MRDIDKELRSLGNNINIEIPKSLREKVNETYKIIEKENVNGRKCIKNIIKVAAAIIVVVIGVNLLSPTIAQEIPLFGPVIKVINESFGIGIKYTENGLAIHENFETENYKVIFESIDYNGSDIMMIYKVETNEEELGLYVLECEIEGIGFEIDGTGAMATGDFYEGDYYGYFLCGTDFKEAREFDEITIKITPKFIEYLPKNKIIREEIINSKTIEYTIKNKNLR